MTTTSERTAVIGRPLPRSTPEEQGVPSAALLALVDRLEAQGSEPHSLMVLRHGHLVAEGWWTPYHRDGIQLLYSLSKSFTSTALGLAVGEGRLRTEDTMADHFRRAARDAGPRAAALTVHDVLSMNTGHREDSLTKMVGPGVVPVDSPERAFFDYEPEEEPGTWFVYDNGATFLCGALVQQVTGERLVDYLRPRLFEPLGIAAAGWQQLPDGRDMGFSGLHLSTEAIARFGLLALADGVWEGRQVVPAGWFGRATSALTDNSMNVAGPDWVQGYGYQFWRCQHDGVRGDGAFGQFCVLLPAHELVLVLTSSTEDMQAELDAVWDELLPHLADTALPADPDALARLTARLDAATLPVRSSGAGSAAGPAGVGPWTFRHEPTEEHPALTGLTVARAAGADLGWALTIEDGGTVEAPCVDGGWPAADGPYLASGGWTDPETFVATVVAVQTPHSVTLTASTAAGTVTAEWNTTPLRWRSLSDLVAPPS